MVAASATVATESCKLTAIGRLLSFCFPNELSVFEVAVEHAFKKNAQRAIKTKFVFILRIKLLVLNVNRFGSKSQQLLWSIKLVSALFCVVLVKQFKAGKFHRFCVDISEISRPLKNFITPSVHIHYNLHFRHFFNLLIIGKHSLCKPMHD